MEQLTDENLEVALIKSYPNGILTFFDSNSNHNVSGHAVSSISTTIDDSPISKIEDRSNDSNASSDSNDRNDSNDIINVNSIEKSENDLSLDLDSNSVVESNLVDKVEDITSSLSPNLLSRPTTFQVSDAALPKKKWNAVFNGSEKFQRSVSLLYDDMETSDFDLVFTLQDGKEQVFPMHSIIVRQHSKYLKDKLTKLFQQKDAITRPRLVLSSLDIDVPPRYLKSVLKYMYTGSMRCPAVDKVMVVYKIISKLKVDNLKRAMLAYMATCLTPLEAIHLIQKGIVRSNLSIFEVCVKIISVLVPTLFSPSKRDAVMEWSADSLRRFIAISGSLVSEEDLFETAREFSYRNASAYNMEPKQLFQKYFDSNIRYVRLTAKFLYNSVIPLDWTRQEFLRETFKYIAVGPKFKELMEISNPRCTSREQPNVYRYSFMNPPPPEFKVSEYGLRVGFTLSHTFKTIPLNRLWKKPGKYYIEFLIVNSSDPSSIFIGVYQSKDIPDGYAAQYTCGVQLYMYNGHIYQSSSSTAYGTKVNINDKVGMYLDARSTSCDLYFYHNGVCLGKVGSKELKLPLQPCVSLYNSLDDVRILPNARIPLRP